MNGKIQYGSASRLTAPPTLTPHQRSAADARRRVRGFVRDRRRTALLVIGVVLVGAVCVPYAGSVPVPLAAVVFGAAWLSLVLAMTLPNGSHVAERELGRRLAQFRHELHAAGDEPDRSTLERLIARVDELELAEGHVREELAQLLAALEGLDLRESISRGDLPCAPLSSFGTPGDVCHFSCPARFGRRRGDQAGHLVLTSRSLHFRGALDVSVSWSEIAAVRRNGREILLTLHGSPRLLRFVCNTYGEAARGGVMADHLARVICGAAPSGFGYEALA